MTGEPCCHGLWIAALAAVWGLTDPMYALLAQLLLIAAWADRTQEAVR